VITCPEKKDPFFRKSKNNLFIYITLYNAFYVIAVNTVLVWAKQKDFGDQTLNPASRKHILCNSIASPHFSSPSLATHSSLVRLVSGQAQQIFSWGLVVGVVFVFVFVFA